MSIPIKQQVYIYNGEFKAICFSGLCVIPAKDQQVLTMKKPLPGVASAGVGACKVDLRGTSTREGGHRRMQLRGQAPLAMA